jgi:Cu/Ag efflux protein CusF
MKAVIGSAAIALAVIFIAPAIAASEHDNHAGHAAPSRAVAEAPMAEGVVKKLDSAKSRITIAHGEIANLGMRPMTMSFKARPPAILKQWKEGDKIRFRAEDIKGVLTVTSIESAK